MDFGKLANVDKVRWDLPPDDPASIEFLHRRKKTGTARFFVGTPAWGHKEWLGKIYPPKTKAADFLRFYSQNFNTIELNTTHYRIPTAEQVAKWEAQVPPGFLFCPKLLQTISHSGQGLADKALLRQWFDFLQAIEKHRGPCFAQFPPHFDYTRKAVLFHFLQEWPSEFELALEFRHPSWFHEGQILPALSDYLRKRNIGLVITDVAGRRDVLHTTISASFVMLRFIGNDLHPSDSTRAQAWARRLAVWSQAGLESMFYFVHEPDDIKAPEMATMVIEDLNTECGARLPPLKFFETNTSFQGL